MIGIADEGRGRPKSPRATLEAELEACRNECGRLGLELDAQLRRNSELGRSIACLQAELADAEEARFVAERNLATVHESISWRLTGPLRASRQLLRRMGRP